MRYNNEQINITLIFYTICRCQSKNSIKRYLGIQAVYFHSNSDTEKFNSTMAMQNDFYVYGKMKNGNYNICDLIPYFV
jgi:hypothetical protein